MDGIPVSFIVVDPHRVLQFPQGGLPYAFICDVATRTDRRGEGHFRATMEDTLGCLRAAGIPLVLTHGRYHLYRRFGFEVFTYHCGLFVTPERIETTLASAKPRSARKMLTIDDNAHFRPDLLVVSEVMAASALECVDALRLARSAARERNKARILFEHPSAPSYGSGYPLYPSPVTPFTRLALACGAELRLQAPNPEGEEVPDADWIKVLDTATFVSQALRLQPPVSDLPAGQVCLETEAGVVTIRGSGTSWEAREGPDPRLAPVTFPARALAWLVTGYHTPGSLAVLYGLDMPPGLLHLLTGLFAPGWRFSRNESWTFSS
jgi:hypothetical protein